MIKKLIIALFVFGGFFSYAQIQDYAYKREIKGITETWQSIPLPNSIFEKTKNNLEDIRIYGITKNDTLEVPFVLQVKNTKSNIKSVDFKMLNESHTVNQYFYTFELGEKITINELFLNFDTSNFDYKLKLEGSQNQLEWFTIKEEYRILSIQNSNTSYKYTTVNFPDASYAYYRIAINTAENPKLIAAQIFENNSTPPVYKSFTPKNLKITEDKNNKETILDIELKEATPISLIQINVNDKLDYLRPTTITYVVDSVKTEKGWIYNYRNLSSSILSSLNNNEFTFLSTKVKKIKIQIRNQDNQALNIKGASIKGFEHELKARFNEPAQYFMVYGNKLAQEPIYDINMMKNVIPEFAQSVSLGEEMSGAAIPEVQKKPLFENKNWLWFIMVLIIALIGYFMAKMIKKT